MKWLYIILGFLFLSVFTETKAQVAPTGAAHEFSKVVYQNTPVGYKYVQARCDVATLKKGISNNGTIEIDFIEVIQENLNTHQFDTIAREDYNVEGKTLTTWEGGLYEREPWFIDDDKPRLMTNAVETGGTLLIKVGEQSNFISHIWTKCTEITPPNTRFYVNVRFRIAGEIGFQFGLDCSPTSDCSKKNHIEAFVSTWYSDTKGQFITETFPDYSKLEMFGREHYGVYSNGTFFVSKPLVDYIQGKSVKIITPENGWQQEPMTLIGNKYQININKSLQGNIRYSFQVDGSEKKYIPHAVDNALLYWDEDVQINLNNNGYDFVTEAINPLSVESQQSLEVLQLTKSPDGVYLFVHSSYPIKRLYVTDMNGRKSFDYTMEIPDKIIIAGTNTGTYILTIETDHGTFSKKFIK